MNELRKNRVFQTSFRLEESAVIALSELAEKCHKGIKTAAFEAAIKRYHADVFSVSLLAWVAVRPIGKLRCASCNNPVEGPGFVQLDTGGNIGQKVYCGRCAK